MLYFATSALAQNPTADAAFKRGRALMKAGKYREACEALEESQRLDPQLPTLFELGTCHEKIGKIASAWMDYREIASRDPDKRRRKRAGEIAAKLAARVPKLLVEIDHDLPGLAVTLSGRDITEQVGVDIPIDPGTYAVTATATGFRDAIRDVKVGADGRVVTLQLTLEPIGDRPPDKPPDKPIDRSPEVPRVDNKRTDPPVDPPPIDQPKPEPPASRRKMYAVLSAVAGAGATGATIYYSVIANNDWNRALQICGGNPCKASADDQARATTLARDAHREGNIATVFGVASAAFFAGGVYLWLTAPDDARVSVTPTASATGAGVSLSGRF